MGASSIDSLLKSPPRSRPNERVLAHASARVGNVLGHNGAVVVTSERVIAGAKPGRTLPGEADWDGFVLELGGIREIRRTGLLFETLEFEYASGDTYTITGVRGADAVVETIADENDLERTDLETSDGRSGPLALVATGAGVLGLVVGVVMACAGVVLGLVVGDPPAGLGLLVVGVVLAATSWKLADSAGFYGLTTNERWYSSE